jgi:tRNA-modifying protein YgfZ
MSNPSIFANSRLFDRVVIRLSATDDSEDVRAFLQGLVTQDTALVTPGRPAWSALLSPQGKVLFDFFLHADEAAPGDVLIDCEVAASDALVKRLSLYRLRRKIQIALDDGLGVFWVAEPGPNTDPRLAELGQRWIAPNSDEDEDVSAAYHEHRLSLGVTEGLAELGDGQTLWLEANAIELNGVSFTKGCYIGQENTARMNWRSKVNRRMVVVPMAQADEKRQRLSYPEHGLSVEHRRTEDMASLNLPAWLAVALVEDAVEE